MQSLHELSYLEMLAYSLCYFSSSAFSWECRSTLLLNTSSTIPIIKIILMFTFHVVANLVQLLFTKPQLNTLSSTLTLALIWPQNLKVNPISWCYLTQNSFIPILVTFYGWEILKTTNERPLLVTTWWTFVINFWVAPIHIVIRLSNYVDWNFVATF